MLEKISNPIRRELELFENEYALQFQSKSDSLFPFLCYINQEKGKRIRPILFFLSQGLIGSPTLESICVAVLLEILHTATLIHDDIVDGSFVRRGKKTPNALWGNKVSVLLGDYLLAKVLLLGVKVQWNGVMEIIAKVVMDMGHGELRQVVIGSTSEYINENEYYQIIKDKTAALFQATCELGGLVLHASQEEKSRLSQFGEYFGMSFQIRDDILDLTGYAEVMGKPSGQDIFNGKLTLPLILALTNVSKKEREQFFKRVESMKTENIKWILQFINSKKGIERAQTQSEIFAKKAIEILNTFKPSVYRESMEMLVMHDLKRIG